MTEINVDKVVDKAFKKALPEVLKSDTFNDWVWEYIYDEIPTDEDLEKYRDELAKSICKKCLTFSLEVV